MFDVLKILATNQREKLSVKLYELESGMKNFFSYSKALAIITHYHT
jgi:hypothetical protein